MHNDSKTTLEVGDMLVNIRRQLDGGTNMGTRNTRTLECGCCGKAFKGKQHWNYDTGFGRCLKCCIWILGRKDMGEHETILTAVPDQWPEAWRY